MKSKASFHHRSFMRQLRFEGLEGRVLMAADLDDTLSESVVLGSISTTPRFVSDSISPDTDVDMYRFTVAAGQVVDFDIDTAANGPAGLGSYLRLFNASGQQLAFNDNAIAPGESPGFDAYLRFTFTQAGTYFLGVSNFNNASYNALTGNGDVAGGLYATGAYQLIVQALPVDTNDALAEALFLGPASTTPRSVSEAISPDVDVDMYRFTATAGQVIDIDIDTPQNGPGGLGSFLRLFNASGQQLASNNDAAAPGETSVGFDAYLRFNVGVSGTYYVAVSNANNTQYSPINGAGDLAGGLHSVGSYQLDLTVVPSPVADPDDSLAEATLLGPISATPTVLNEAVSPDTDVDM
jgi:hypothetical protein